jgi:hypothetical protein
MYNNLTRLDSDDEEGILGESTVNPVVVPALLTTFAILLAVVTVSWMGGLTGLYAPNINVEVMNVTCALDDYGNWEIFVKLENCGDSKISFSKVLLNGTEVSSYGAAVLASLSDSIATGLRVDAASEIAPGECADVVIWVGAKCALFKRGSVVEVRIICAGGAEIVERVRLV